MIREALTLVRGAKRPRDLGLELKTDRISWRKLVEGKIGEAQAQRLPSRFIHTGNEDSYYFSILKKGSYTLVFCYALTTRNNIPAHQAIILDVESEPRYAYEVKALETDGMTWAISNKKEDTDMIGQAFRYLKKANLFDPGENDDVSWMGRYPNADGLIRNLEIMTGQRQ